MLAVIFEVWPHEDQRAPYLELAASLREEAPAALPVEAHLEAGAEDAPAHGVEAGAGPGDDGATQVADGGGGPASPTAFTWRSIR